MTDCVNLLHANNQENYIKFLCHFGPALTGVKIWNADKANIPVSELLTNSDEAFIHLCIVNYSATWKAQEKHKTGQTDIEVPVSSHLLCDANKH